MPQQLADIQSLTTAYAKRLYVAMGLAMPRLDTSTVGVLNQRVSDSTVRWALALVIALWRLNVESPGRGFEQLFLKAGGEQVLTDLRRVITFFPDSLRQFIDRTLKAESEATLVGCAVYFVGGVKDLAEKGYLSLLHRWLAADNFREVGQRLVRDYPEPGSERPPESAQHAELSSRGARFDRGDFEARSARRSATTPVELSASDRGPKKG